MLSKAILGWRLREHKRNNFFLVLRPRKETSNKIKIKIKNGPLYFKLREYLN